jgi:hypothetical protein
MSWATRVNPGNYTAAANDMQWVGVERMLIRWTTETRVTGIVRNKDLGTGTVMEKNQWKATQMLDANYCTKAFVRKLDGLKAADKERIRELKEKLRRFLGMVVYSEADLAAKVDLWLNAENRNRGDHTCCRESNQPSYECAHQADTSVITVLG